MLLCRAGEEHASFTWWAAFGPPPRNHAYKCIGAPHCVESGPTLCPIVDESTRNDSHGQQGDSSIHKSPRGRALGTAAEHSETAVMLGAHALALHQSSVHPRCPEQRGRHDVEGGSSNRRLDSAPRSDQSDMERVWEGGGRPIRHAGEHTVRAVVLSQREGQSPTRGGCVRSQTLAEHTPVRFPARPPDSPSLGLSPRGAAVYDSHECTVVSLLPASALGAAEGTPLAAGRGSNHRLPRDRPALVGLAAERERLEGLGLSQEVVRTIQGARADSTRACYSAKWAAFQKWCTERGCDPISCPLPHVLSFLQTLMERGLAFSTVKTYAAAVLSCHEGFGDKTVFSHPLKGTYYAFSTFMTYNRCYND